MEVEEWAYRQIRTCVVAVQKDEESLGVMSTGERLAVALVLNRADLLAKQGYSLADAVARVGDAWMPHVVRLSREFAAAAHSTARAPGQKVE